MSRYFGPRLRIVRRLGELSGLTNKTTKITAPPGQHGALKKKAKMSQYSARLVQKQRLRFNYGITEKKLLSYVKKAAKSKNATGNVLLQLLEMRLDNIVFRLGFTPTIAAARQIINHRQVKVNNNIVSIASYECKPLDTISILTTAQNTVGLDLSKENRLQNSDGSETSGVLSQGLTGSKESKLGKVIPPHLHLESQKKLTGKVLSIVDRRHVGVALNERLIVEFYSRKV